MSRGTANALQSTQAHGGFNQFQFFLEGDSILTGHFK